MSKKNKKLKDQNVDVFLNIPKKKVVSLLETALKAPITSSRVHDFSQKLPFIFGIVMLLLGFTEIWKYAIIVGVIGLTACYLFWDEVLDKIKQKEGK